MRIHGGFLGIKKNYDKKYRYIDYMKLKAARLGIDSMYNMRLAIAKLNREKE